MENKFIFLSTCSTCKKIINVLGIENKSFLQDVKQKILSKNQLDFLYNYTKSYEALINKRGLVYKKLKQDGLILNEKKFKELLEKEYSCVKRPILFWNNKVYIGNSKSTVEMMNSAING